MIASRLGIRRLGLAALASLAALVATLAVAAVPASALKTRLPLFSFSVPKAGGVAIDQSNGDVYVVDGETKAVLKLDAEGHAVDFSALGSSELAVAGLNKNGHLAVEPINGDLYVGIQEGSKSTVERFAPSGEAANFTAGPAAGTNLLTGADDPTKHLGAVTGLAVDSSGDLFVAQNVSPKALDEFAPTGAYTGLEISGSVLRFPSKVAVSSTGAIYAVENSSGNVLEFSPTGTLLGTCDGTGLAAGSPLTVEPASGSLLVSHHIYAATTYVPTVVQYSAGCAGIELEFRYAFGSAANEYTSGIAVNSTSTADPADEQVYVSNGSQGRVEVYGPTTVVPDAVTLPASNTGVGTTALNGTVNSGGMGSAEAFTDCHFEYVTDAAYETDVESGGDGFSNLASGGSESCTSVDGKTISKANEISDDGNSHTVSTEVSGLSANTVYRFRLQASNSNGANPAPSTLSFLTPGPPSIDATYATNVSATSAGIGAEVNPHLLDTSYQFEYVNDATYHHDVETLGAGHGFDDAMLVPESAAELGAGADGIAVSAHLTGLSRSTAYHYRVVATNSYGTVTGAEQVFTTQRSGAPLQLLDERQWELVSPPDKHGARIFGLSTDGVFRSTPDGKAITYVTTSPTEAEPEGYDGEIQVLSKRNGASWSSKDISPPNSQAGGLEVDPTYQFVSEDLASYLVYPFSGASTPLLSPLASAPTPYLRRQATCEAEGEGASGGCYVPLLTTRESAADMPAGTEFDTSGSDRVHFEGATPRMHHVFLNYNVALTETPTNGKPELYEWSPGRSGREALKLISIMPEAEGGGPATASYVSIGGNPGDAWSGARHAISDHGTRVFWTAYVEGGLALYLRDTAKAAGAGETIRLDVPQPGAPGGTPNALFQFATPDGSRVFFRDQTPLTEDSGSGSGSYHEGGDLYECRIVEAEGKDACDLTDLTPLNGAGEEADVMNILPGAAEDGSYIYFVANGVLAEGATGGHCASEGPGTQTCNMYVYHDGVTKFIATLSEEDENDWGGLSPIYHNLGRLTAEASRNGRYLAFMSNRELTKYDNRDVKSKRPAEEVYLYDALTEKLVCASCNPTGARPTGITVGEFTGVEGGRPNLAAVPSDAGRSETEIAANLPRGDSLGQYGESLYQARYLTNDGRLVFNSATALVPQDINGNVDVYEYEPAGVGSCDEATPTFSKSSAGCADLVSSGTAAGESGFLEASEGGRDIFFVTGEQLTRSDRDTALDVYDARVCSQIEPCPNEAAAPPPCASTDACRQAPSVQPSVFGSTASATFSGTGNLKPSRPAGKGSNHKLSAKQWLRQALKRCGRRHNGHKRDLCKRRVRAKFLTRKQRLRLVLRKCSSQHRHSRPKRRRCKQRARRSLAKGASVGRRRHGRRHHKSARSGR